MQNYVDFIFLGIYLLGGYFIPKWRHKAGASDWKFWALTWTVLMFFLYLLFLEGKEKTVYFLIPLFFFGLFALFYFREKRRLINGLLFNIFLLSFVPYLVLLVIRTQNLLLLFLGGLAAVGLVIIALVGIYALLIFLYWNAIVVMRKEGHSLANLLTLLLAIFLTIILVYNFFVARMLPAWVTLLFSILPLLMTYFFVVLYNFLTVSVLYQFNHPKYKQDYLVVLGSGLINGSTVPPLLKARVDKAIQFYKAQTRATLHSPTIVMSGGQGPDELLPESIAMKNYAITQGIPEEDILVETNSRNTLENMRFSKEIMTADFGSGQFNAIFTTNNYHLFRAGLFAKMAHLNADGIGAKTAFYFLPNAFLREYIAILSMNKRRHLIVCGLISAMMIGLALIGLFIN